MTRRGDVALLQLAQPSTAAVLPDRHRRIDAQLGLPGRDTPIVVAGWGWTSATAAAASSHLNWIDLSVQDDHYCARQVASLFHSATMFCGSPAWGSAAGACYGDSGAPAVARSPSGKYVIAGVASVIWARRALHRNIFARVSALSGWLERDRGPAGDGSARRAAARVAHIAELVVPRAARREAGEPEAAVPENAAVGRRSGDGPPSSSSGPAATPGACACRSGCSIAAALFTRRPRATSSRPRASGRSPGGCRARSSIRCGSACRPRCWPPTSPRRHPARRCSSRSTRRMGTGRMHAGEADIDDDLVRRLIAGQFPHWAGLTVQRFASGGTVNAMYRLGEDMVVRLPLVEGGANDVARERTVAAPARSPPAHPRPRGARGRAARRGLSVAVVGVPVALGGESRGGGAPERACSALEPRIWPRSWPRCGSIHPAGRAAGPSRRTGRLPPDAGDPGGDPQNCAGSRTRRERRAAALPPPFGRRHCGPRAGTARRCGPACRSPCRATCWWTVAG